MATISASRPLAIVGATVIDGTDRPPIENATILIERDRFTAVGPSTTMSVPDDATVINALGKFVTPGLTDMHVHVYTPERWHPELYLAAGVTTTLDLGGQIENVTAYRDAIESGMRLGPRLYFTGPLLEEARPYEGFASFSRHVDAARIEDVVDGLGDAGAIGVKLYVSVRPTTAERACRRAHARGLPVFMHQHATWGLEAPVAGVDCVEHMNVFGGVAPERSRPADAGRMTPFEYGAWMWSQFGDIDLTADPVRRLYDALIANGTNLDPTLVLYASRPGALGDDVGDTSMDDPERTPLLSRLPTPVREELVNRWAERRKAAAGASDRAKERTRRAWENMLALVAGFHRAGGAVLAGTDCPNVAIVSGFSLHRELELLVRAGLSTRDAIIAATRRPAERLRKTDVFGTIAPGRSADLLILHADPLTDIRNIRRIDKVVARGVVHDPEQILSGVTTSHS